MPDTALTAVSTHRMLDEATALKMLDFAESEGLSDAERMGLAVGCPTHGNAWMDWDESGIFCHRCL